MQNFKFFLREHPRTYAQAGKIGGFSPKTIASLTNRKRKDKKINPSSVFLYRAFLNLSDDIVEFLQNDENFQNEKFLKIKTDFWGKKSQKTNNARYYESHKANKQKRDTKVAEPTLPLKKMKG